MFFLNEGYFMLPRTSAEMPQIRQAPRRYGCNNGRPCSALQSPPSRHPSARSRGYRDCPGYGLYSCCLESRQSPSACANEGSPVPESFHTFRPASQKQAPRSATPVLTASLTLTSASAGEIRFRYRLQGSCFRC